MTGLQEQELFKKLEKMTEILVEQNIRLDELNKTLTFNCGGASITGNEEIIECSGATETKQKSKKKKND